eukprot:Hpha_TRINITY_DN1654_c0_g1::TRINITY_DN1654_c0_g1_i1::g.48737::m.48737
MSFGEAVQVWESQRFRLTKGFSASYLLPWDWPEWADAEGRKRPEPKGVQCSEGKEWVDEWEVVVQQRRTDDEGWEYAVDFRLWDWYPKRKAVHFVRRRCWRREARPIGGVSSRGLSFGAEATGLSAGTEEDDEVSEEGSPAGWVPDDQAIACALCEKSFTALRRKHHCRKCGGCVCSGCSQARESLPGHVEEQRVCDKCKSSNASQGYYPGKIINRMKQKVIGKAEAFQEAASVVKLTQAGEVAGETGFSLSLRVREGRALVSALTTRLEGGAAVGTPNPYVLARCGGVEMTTAKKAQTHHPVWSPAEGSFTNISVSDPSSTLWLHVFDCAPAIRGRRVVGRAAVPLPWLMKQPGGERKELWLCIMPPPRRGREAEEKEGKEQPDSPTSSVAGPPVKFRGASPVSELLGMKLPKRSLGLLCVDVKVTVPGFKASTKAMFGAPALDSVAEADDPFDVEIMQDNAARLSSRLGQPWLLVLVGRQAIATKLAILPFWALVCLNARPATVPFVAAALLAINGYVGGKISKTSLREGIIIWEDHNPYSEPSLQHKLMHKILPAVKAVQSLQNPIGRAATSLSRTQSLLSWEDSGVTMITLAVLGVAAVILAVVLELACLVPVRFYFFIFGVAAVLGAPGEKKQVKEGEGPEEGASNSGEKDKAAQVTAAAVNFWTHSPDDRELVHRAICEMLIVDPKDVPAVGEQDRLDRLVRLDPGAASL